MSDRASLVALTADDFRAALARQFQAAGIPPLGTVTGRTAPGELEQDGQALSFVLELVEVTEDPRPPVEGFRRQFSVIFHGPLEPVLPQGHYRLENEQMGTLELFLVPLGPDTPADRGQQPTVMQYEAVFG